MKLSLNKKRLALSFIFFILVIRVLFSNIDLFLINTHIYNKKHIAICVFLTFLTSILILFKFEFKKTSNNIFSVIILIFSPIVVFFTVELFNGNNLLTEENLITEATIYFLNLLILYIFELLLFLITNSSRISLILNTIFFNTLSIVNYVVVLFRGQPFVPWDIYSIGTALSVVKGYKISFNQSFILAIFIIGFQIALYTKFNIKFPKKKIMFLVRFCLSIILLFFMILFYIFDFSSIFKLKTLAWESVKEYQINGVIAGFFYQSKNIFIKKPDGYSVSNLKNTYSNKSKSSVKPNKKPNIIVIMNESFSDFSVLGIETNQEYLPFYNSLSQNCIKGNLHVSIFGAGTPNTEWEFLTGNTLAFMSSGAVPYQQYIHKPVQSLVKLTKQLNYSNFALHSFYKKGYRRSSVYPLLGFDKFIDLKEMVEFITFTRGYVSDAGTYDKLLNEFKNKPKGKPQFSFTVTMQNHGPYEYRNFETPIQTTNLSKSYSKANQFLSLISISDQALKDLIEQLEKEKEPTILLLFGDHQPNIEASVYNEALSKLQNSNSIEITEKKFITPFLIWANYDIEEKEVPDISANYLSTLLFETAGLPLTTYQEFLSDLRKEIPVITSNCYIDKTGKYHKLDEKNEYTELLKEYQYLQYNNVFDTKNTINEIFYYQ